MKVNSPDQITHTYEREWHLDKKVNISIIGAVVLYGLIFGTIYGSLSKQVERNTTDIALMVSVQHKVIRIEENVAHMQSDIREMTLAMKELTKELKKDGE